MKAVPQSRVNCDFDLRQTTPSIVFIIITITVQDTNIKRKIVQDSVKKFIESPSMSKWRKFKTAFDVIRDTIAALVVTGGEMSGDDAVIAMKSSCDVQRSR